MPRTYWKIIHGCNTLQWKSPVFLCWRCQMEPGGRFWWLSQSGGSIANVCLVYKSHVIPMQSQNSPSNGRTIPRLFHHLLIRIRYFYFLYTFEIWDIPMIPHGSSPFDIATEETMKPPPAPPTQVLPATDFTKHQKSIGGTASAVWRSLTRKNGWFSMGSMWDLIVSDLMGLYGFMMI